MYCTNCGAETTKSVCSACGVKQNKNHKYCKWCGSELAENASVCVQCNKKVKESKILKFLSLTAEILFLIIFAIVFIASFTYFSKGVVSGGILLLLSGLCGFLISLPLVRKIINKNTKNKLLKSFRVMTMILCVVLIYGAIYPFANNQAANIEKQKQYDAAMALMETDPLAAKESFLGLADFEDSSEKAEEVNQHIYTKLEEKLNTDFTAEEDISEAEEYVDALPENFDDSLNLMKEFRYKKGVWMLENHFYANAKYVFKDISDYKDVNELMNNQIFNLMGNTYTYSSSVNYAFDTYIQTQLLSFRDRLNYSFAATYRISNATVSGMLNGDFSNSDTELQYDCYEENGKIYVGSEELTQIKMNGDKIQSFIYKGNLYTLAET